MEIKEIINFESQPAELFLSVCQLGGEKEHLLG